MFCTLGTFRTDLDKKNFFENSLFAIRFLSVFFVLFHAHFLGLWSFADSIRKWSRANPASVSGCIWTVHRDRGLLLFGGHLMVLVVVCWSLAVTWGLVWGHLMDLVVRAFFFFVYVYVFVCACVCVFCMCICLNV